MKEVFKKLFDIHSAIGKVCTIFCVTCLVCAVIGLITGTTKILKKNDVVETNYFINENVDIHDKNYSIVVKDVNAASSIDYLDKSGNNCVASGNFILVTIELKQYENSSLKSHKIDTNDFKLKDHTGVYVPMSDIMGAVGWDAIDIHFDEKDGGHVMSSTEFSTKNAYKDCNYCTKFVNPGEIFCTTIIFEFDQFIDPASELLVMEVDFFTGSSNYKQGTDIILLDRPVNLS